MKKSLLDLGSHHPLTACVSDYAADSDVDVVIYPTAPEMGSEYAVSRSVKSIAHYCARRSDTAGYGVVLKGNSRAGRWLSIELGEQVGAGQKIYRIVQPSPKNKALAKANLANLSLSTYSTYFETIDDLSHPGRQGTIGRFDPASHAQPTSNVALTKSELKRYHVLLDKRLLGDLALPEQGELESLENRLNLLDAEQTARDEAFGAWEHKLDSALSGLEDINKKLESLLSRL